MDDWRQYDHYKMTDGWNHRPEGWEEIEYRLIEDYHLSPDPLHRRLNKYNQEVIFVLAGGLTETAKNHQWVIRRLDLALHLYGQKKRKIICLGGGTYHKPPSLNKHNFVIHESTACVQYLIDNGVHPDDLMREWSSYDTIANGFFSLVNYSLPMEIKSAIVITSDFHMPRTKAIFHWIYSLTPRSSKIELEFLSVDSKDLEENVITARKKREHQSLANLQDKIKKITTLKDFHHWFFTEHKAYDCHFSSRVKEHVDDEIYQSY